MDSSQGFQSAGWPCIFWICQPPQLREPISWNKSFSLYSQAQMHILLVLFLWRTLTNTLRQSLALLVVSFRTNDLSLWRNVSINGSIYMWILFILSFPSPTWSVLSKKMLISRRNSSFKKELTSSIYWVHHHWRLTSWLRQTLSRFLGMKCSRTTMMVFLLGDNCSLIHTSVHRRLLVLPPLHCCHSSCSWG